MNSEAGDVPAKEQNGRAYLLLSLTALCWAANTIFGQLAVGEVSPMALVVLRWLGVLILLLVFARGHIRRDWPVLRRHLVFVSAMGMLGFAGFNGLFYTAAHSTTAVNMGILQGSIPMFVMIGAIVVLRTPVTAMQGVGVLATMVGVALVATGGEFARFAQLAVNHGDLLMIIACALYAGYTVALRRRPASSPLGLFTLMAAAAFVTALPMAVAEAAAGDFCWPTTMGWLIVTGVTLFPSFLAQIFFIQGVEMIGPARAGVFVNLVPVFAAVLAVAFLNESFEAFHGVALGLVLGGIWLSERGKAG
jgi:drug/metabolite transporter (DMT)-like permease